MATQTPSDDDHDLINNRTVLIKQATKMEAQDILRHLSKDNDDQNWGMILKAAPEALTSLGLCFIAAGSLGPGVKVHQKKYDHLYVFLTLLIIIGGCYGMKLRHLSDRTIFKQISRIATIRGWVHSKKQKQRWTQCPEAFNASFSRMGLYVNAVYE
jgi:hypothetical protein